MERFDHQPLPASTRLEQLIIIINRRFAVLERLLGFFRREGNGLRVTASYIELEEPDDVPAAPEPSGIGYARLFVRVNGANKLELCVRFQTGATQVIATQP